MRFPVLIVLLVSTVGVLYSGWLVRDAWKDRKARRYISGKLVERITKARLVDETARLIAQVLFLIAAGFAALELFPVTRLSLVVLIPVLLMFWSGWSTRVRRQLLTKEDE